MSFSFGFDEDVMDQDEVAGGVKEATHHPINQQQQAKAHPTHSIANRSLSLASLLETLPDRISYSTISTQSSVSDSASSSSSSSSQALFLPRRDLFDARFQILHEQTQDVDGDEEAGSQPISNSQQQANSDEGAAVVGTESDLIPGLYEGGLKTWECSVDLAVVVHGLVQAHGIEAFQGKNIVELGCGTALPSCMLLQLLLSSLPPTSPPSTPTTIHLCDYNLKVLELVTLANLLLAYHFITATSPDLMTGELDLTPEFLQGFTESLEARSIRLAFHSGPWEGLDLSSTTADQATKADYIFTSETTYTPTTIDSLLSTLHRLARPTTSSAVQTGTTILVATKNYYFGLGGGVHALRQALLAGSSIDAATAWAEEVTSTTKGVARSVLGIGWN